MPVTHGGSFADLEMVFEQSVFAVCPAQVAAPPSLALVFELFQLKHGAQSHFEPTAWTALPLCDASGLLVAGKFKLPMLRGGVDLRVNKYAILQTKMAASLEAWVGNLYFEVTKLSRFVAGQKEHEVELEYTSALLGYPDLHLDDGEEESATIPPGLYDQNGGTLGQAPMNTSSQLPGSLSPRKQGSDAGRKNDVLSLSDDEDNAKSGLGDQVARSDRRSDDTEKYAKWNAKEGLATPLLATKLLSADERLEDYSPALTQSLTAHSAPLPATVGDKAYFACRLFMSELGLRRGQPRTYEFWVTVLFMLVVFWLRMWLHYLGQYVYLESIGIAITEFELGPVSVELNYQPTFMLTREVVGVVCLGPIFVLLFFTTLLLTSMGAQKLVSFVAARLLDETQSGIKFKALILFLSGHVPSRLLPVYQRRWPVRRF